MTVLQYKDSEGRTLSGFSQIDLNKLQKWIKWLTVVFGVFGFFMMSVIVWIIWQVKKYKIVTLLIKSMQ